VIYPYPEWKVHENPNAPLGTVKTYPDPERKAYKKISRVPLRYPEDIP